MTTTSEAAARPRRALICGAGGQDGAYLASFLLAKGYEVVGTSRDAANAHRGGLRKLGIEQHVRLVSMTPNDFRSVMPTNLYDPGDNFHPENSNVIPALLRRFHEAVQTNASEVVIWGSGTLMREFLHVDDMAAASVHVMELDDETYRQHTKPMLSHINVGTGVDCTIRELAETIARVTGFKGCLGFDASKPDGTPRKLMDVSRLKALGWSATITLEDGLRDAYGWFLAHLESART